MSQSQDSLVVRAPAHWAAGGALAALTVLTTVLGLQLIRLFLPTLLFYLMDTAGLTIFPMAGIGSTVFLTSFLARPLQRLVGLRGALALSVGGTAIMRLAEQWVTSPPVDLVLSIAGTVLFLQVLPLGLGAARAFRPSRATGFALAVLVGVVADSALHIASGTYDLTWQNDLLPALVVLTLVLATLASLLVTLRGLPPRPAGVSWRHAWPLLAIGPWLALQLIVFQNTARAAALTGWPGPAAGFLITAGNILALAAARFAAGMPRRVALAAGVALALLLALANLPPPGAAFVILAGQLLSAMLFLRAAGSSDAGSDASPGLGRTSVAYGLGFLLFILLFFAYTAPNNLALPYSSPAVLPVMALVVGLAAAVAPSPEARAQPLLRLPALAVAALVLLLAPAGLALTWQPPALSPVPAASTLRFMTYNLHNGFNVYGRLDLEALAAVVEAADPDIVTLQEVSRGWVITGSADMLAWLANRLDMGYVAGPTTDDGQWGNAILSRYPIVTVEQGRLFSEGQALKRGYLQVDVDTGRAAFRAISTHLYQYVNRPEDSVIRQRQVSQLLAAWDATPRTLIAGDLNAWPDHPEMLMMREAGLIDAVGALTAEPAYTSPADAPYQRIDYIWLSPDLAPESFALSQSTASDHLPVLVVVRFAGE